MYWSSVDCACKCVPHPELCTPTAQSDSVWNNSSCSCNCVEKGAGWCEAYGNSLEVPKEMYFNENTCACSYLEIGCPANYFWNQQIGECSCMIQGCPTGQYFDNVACECACFPQVCPANYLFDNHSCSCVCLEPEGACDAWSAANGDSLAYWST